MQSSNQCEQTKVMSTDAKVALITEDREVIKQIKQFTYLGSIIAANANDLSDLKVRLARGH